MHAVILGAGAASSGQSVLEWLLAEAPDLALTAVATGVAALWWPDSDSGAKATAFCKCVFAMCQHCIQNLHGIALPCTALHCKLHLIARGGLFRQILSSREEP